MSNSPGVISESMSAKGKFSALIRENSEQIAIIKTRMVIDKTLLCFIIDVDHWLSAVSSGVNTLNYISISLKKKTAKAELSEL